MKKEHGKWYIFFGMIFIILIALLCMYPVQTIKVLCGLGTFVIVLMAILNWTIGKKLESFEESFKEEEEKNGRFRHP